MAKPIQIAASYCQPGGLDRVLDRLLLPAHRGLLEGWDGLVRFWYFRYPRRGEQWKLRLEAPEEIAAECRDWLAAALGPLEAPAGEPAEPEYPAHFDRLPPVDAEDAGKGLRPERGLFFTTALASPVALGPDRFLADEAYLGAIGGAHAASCRWLATSGSVREAGAFDGASGSERLKVFLPWAVAILGHAPFLPADLATYSLFHRDTLLRYLLAFNDVEEAKQGETLARLAGHAARSAAAVAAAAESLAAWREQPATRDPALAEPLHRLLAVVRDKGKPWHGAQIEPYTRRNDFLPVFKLIDMAANVLGLTKLNQAAALQLISSACGVTPEEQNRLDIFPVFAPEPVGAPA